jgi:hypothetical protein
MLLSQAMYESFFMIDRRLTTLSRPACSESPGAKPYGSAGYSISKVIGKSCKSKEFYWLTVLDLSNGSKIPPARRT